MAAQPYWRSESEDEAMQDAHGFVWKAMLGAVDQKLHGRRVVDIGCNRGGFLRYLADAFRIGHGFGYDPAEGAIEDARRLAGQRSLTFEVAERVPEAWTGFDLAFSHEVLYLLHDLAAHGSEVFRSLAPGGTYFAVMGVHAGSPMIREWHEANREALHMPPLYDVDDVAGAFAAAGFEVSLGRLNIAFMPVSGHTADDRVDIGHDAHQKDLLGWLDYYNEQKILWRLHRPARPSR